MGWSLIDPLALKSVQDAVLDITGSTGVPSGPIAIVSLQVQRARWPNNAEPQESRSNVGSETYPTI